MSKYCETKDLVCASIFKLDEAIAALRVVRSRLIADKAHSEVRRLGKAEVASSILAVSSKELSAEKLRELIIISRVICRCYSRTSACISCVATKDLLAAGFRKMWSVDEHGEDLLDWYKPMATITKVKKKRKRK